MARRLVADADVPLVLTTKQRVIYADTDRMGVVYHATYLRYLEHARVEFIRDQGFAYSAMERLGYGLPVIDLAVTYLASAVYDDVVSVWVGMAKLSPARVHFCYRLTVEPGDRQGFDREAHGEPLELIRAETRHGCVTLVDGRAAAIPEPAFAALDRYWQRQPG